MAYEISQFDIPDRQLLAEEVKPRPVRAMDIGEAKVTRTIFGRPRIRIICERDKQRRVWLLSVLAVILVSGAGWQGWVMLQRVLNAPPPLPLSARIRVSPPVIEPEDFTPAPRKQKTRMQILLEGMATHRPPEPPEPLARAARRADPASSSKVLAANDNAAEVQPGETQQPARIPPQQPQDSAVEAKMDDQPTAGKPAAATTAAGKDALPQPAANDQAGAAVSAKP